MKKVLKSLLVCLVLMVFSVATAMASSVEVSGDKVNAKAGDSVLYSVNIANNVGIAGFKIFLKYDKDVFEYVGDSAVLGNFSKAGTVVGNDYKDGCQVLWYNAENVAGNGSLCSVKLKVKDNAKADTYTIGVGYSKADCINEKLEQVELACEDGYIKIEGASSGSGSSSGSTSSGSDSKGGTVSGANDVVQAKVDSIIMTIGSKNYSLNGMNKTMDSAPFVDKNGRTMVPVRFVAEALGEEVVYNGKDRSISITNKAKDTVVLTINSKEYKVNGVLKNMDSEAIILDNRTMVPIRVIAEAFNAKVNYNESSKKIEITK